MPRYCEGVAIVSHVCMSVIAWQFLGWMEKSRNIAKLQWDVPMSSASGALTVVGAVGECVNYEQV